MLQAHVERGLHAVFRLQRNANSVFQAFFESDRSETVVTVAPPAQSATGGSPLQVRLVSYTAGSTVCGLATTLLDSRRYRAADLQTLYPGRWSIEEYYKTTKKTLCVEQFRGRSERLVRQELYAHCTLTALARLCANHSEAAFREAPDGHGRPTVLANFRPTLHLVGHQLEGLFVQQAETLRKELQCLLDGIARSRQRRRPQRSYPRRSRQPQTKWRNRKATTPAS